MQKNNVKLFSGRFLALSKKFIIGLTILIFGFSVASAGDIGTIDDTYKYAWGENIGWINFGCDNCNVSVRDSEITGHAWSKQYGWILLNPPTILRINNNGEGDLGGYAWGSSVGWIDFEDVYINESGEFYGYAIVKHDNSRINFSCDGVINSCATADFKVKTDWQPVSARSGGGPAGGGVYGGFFGGGDDKDKDKDKDKKEDKEKDKYDRPKPPIRDIISVIIDKNSDNFLKFLGIKKKKEIIVTKEAPFSLKAKWNLLPVKEIKEFVFAPLPYEVRRLVSQFPELGDTLRAVGVKRFSDLERLVGVNFKIEGLEEVDETLRNIGVEKLSDLEKLKIIALNTPEICDSQKTFDTLGVHNLKDLDSLEGVSAQIPKVCDVEKVLADLGVEKLSDINDLKEVTFNVPGLSDIEGHLTTGLKTGKISLTQGLPVSDLPLIAKKNLPTEFVFTRSNQGLIDLDVALSVSTQGKVNQKISSLPGKTLKLVVKPISKARSVTGYIVFKSATPRITKRDILLKSLTASAIFSFNGLAEEQAEPITVENKLVLGSFEYEDNDGDGIYTAEVETPVVPGEYEIITVIEYIDPTLGVRQMRMITVIDPEGYVFEKSDGKETRIPSAIVSLYWLNPATKDYELWPAEKYQQENPQITDVRGTYSFLVPEGSYHFEVEAPGYRSHQGKVFIVTEGNGLHKNIELKSGRGLKSLDWKTVLLIAVFALLLYNLYSNTLKGKLLELFKKYD
ncbi:MAG: carboxypeptidase-like regulatory domain-containing protein [Patescibacteria group bacterium]|nr:carboxypeptidase-like regulatory domain-containing protein [Patescibacteria group bacterium]